MASQTNPIQQRMEYLADQWNDLSKKDCNIIRVLIEKDDYEMLDAFYWYMLGIGTSINDLAIIFETGFTESEEYSKALVEELEETVAVWNMTEFPEGFDKVAINWKPDYTYTDKNESALFLHNITTLLQSIQLDTKRLLVANLIMPQFDRDKQVSRWVDELLQLEFPQQIKIIITDYVSQNVFEKPASIHPEKILTWKPEIDSANVYSQVAAMGDPLYPDTDYRQAFMKMLKAIGESNYKKTVQEGEKCFKIASDNMSKDPNWIAQMVTVLIVLSNEDFKAGKKDLAGERAEKAVGIGFLAPNVLGEQIGCSILGQAFINKGNLYGFNKKWKEAMPLYESAAYHLEKSHVDVSALEAYRMAGYCALKTGDSESALENLYKGFQVAEKLEDKTLKSSSFGLLLILLIKQDYSEKISEEKLAAKAGAVYGEDWREILQNGFMYPDLEISMEENPYLMEEQR